jgi:HSP20 family protein
LQTEVFPVAPKEKNPFKDLVFLQERMTRIFDEALLQYKGSSGLASGAWFPPVDIYETGDKIILKAEIPGVNRKDVSLEVHENVITLKGERRFAKNLREENYHRMERFYGTFQRVFSLPNVVDKGEVTANFKDGVLEITVPKVVEESSSSVKITVE